MTEHRIRWLLAVLLFAQLILLTAQVPSAGGESTFLHAVLLRVVSPFPRAVAATARGISSVLGDIALNRTLVDENRQLRAEVESLRRETARLFGLEADLRRLAAGLEYTRAATGELTVADVVYIDHTSWLQTLVLAVPRAEVRPDHPVVSGNGLVGRVVVVAPPYAKVQLVTDRSASVGVMIARTRRQGVARGAGGGALELDFVPLQADVRVGDQVVTAGIDGVYPRGLSVGTVVSVEPGSQLFHRIRLTPAVDFGLLDQVYVLNRDPVPREIREATPDAQP